MGLHHMPLQRQVDLVFKEIQDELAYLSSGIVFIQIRNNVVGKFGIKHDPIESKGGRLDPSRRVLTLEHLEAFRRMGVDSLQHKKNWTHGEIWFEFALKQGQLIASVQLESNYNMANVMANSARP